MPGLSTPHVGSAEASQLRNSSQICAYYDLYWTMSLVCGPRNAKVDIGFAALSLLHHFPITDAPVCCLQVGRYFQVKERRSNLTTEVSAAAS